MTADDSWARNPGHWCDTCKTRVQGSHYHCSKCGQICSMMGHLSMGCPVPHLGGWKAGDDAVFEHSQCGPTNVTVIKVVRESDAGPHLVVQRWDDDAVTMAEPSELTRPAPPAGGGQQ